MMLRFHALNLWDSKQIFGVFGDLTTDLAGDIIAIVLRYHLKASMGRWSSFWLGGAKEEPAGGTRGDRLAWSIR